MSSKRKSKEELASQEPWNIDPTTHIEMIVMKQVHYMAMGSLRPEMYKKFRSVFNELIEIRNLPLDNI